jgi:hypothetical protein
MSATGRLDAGFCTIGGSVPGRQPPWVGHGEGSRSADVGVRVMPGWKNTLVVTHAGSDRDSM